MTLEMRETSGKLAIDRWGDKGFRQTKEETERAMATPTEVEKNTAYEAVAANVHNHALRLVENTVEHLRLTAYSYLSKFVEVANKQARRANAKKSNTKSVYDPVEEQLFEYLPD